MNIVASILHFNSSESLARVIESVKNQKLPPSRILVVDNGSGLDLSSIQEKYQDVEFVFLPSNEGVGHGHNFAWRYLIDKYSPDLIWALEHDAIPEPNNLKILLEEFLKSQSNVLAVNSIERNDFEYKRWDYYKVRIPNVVKLEDKDLVDNYFGGLSFNGVLIPVSTFEKIGFLREDFFIGFEDIDYTNRIYNAGGKILRITNSYVLHDSFKKHKTLRIGNKVFLFPGNDPIREYYSFRNSLVVHNKQKLFLSKVVFSSFYILLFRGRKLANIAAKILAYRDAVSGRLGKRQYKILEFKW